MSTRRDRAARPPGVLALLALVAALSVGALAGCETDVPEPDRRDDGGVDAGPTDAGVPDGGTDGGVDGGTDGGPPPPADAGCAANGCDDGVACTDDVCADDGRCRFDPVHTRCPSGRFCDARRDCRPGAPCLDDAECAVVMGECLMEPRCDTARRTCVYRRLDADGDGAFDPACGGDDCDDADPARFPGNPEICNGIDDDCDGAADTTLDARACEPGRSCVDGACACDDLGTDCADLECIDTSSDPRHCGGCFVECFATEVCVDGACRCPEGQTFCESTYSCHDLTSDDDACGACGRRCFPDTSGRVCIDSACGCAPGTTTCWSGCYDTTSDPDHCGGCVDAACPEGGQCVDSACRPAVDWVRWFGSRDSVASTSNGLDAAIDSTGRLVMGMTMSRRIDDPDGTLSSSTSTFPRGIVVRMGTDGGRDWHRVLSSSNSVRVRGVATDAADGMLVAGEHGGTLDLGDGAAPVASGWDAFLVRYDDTGAHDWEVRLAGSDSPRTLALLYDAAEDEVVWAGTTSADRDFGGGITTGGDTPVFVARYDATDGSFVDAWRAPGWVSQFALGPGGVLWGGGVLEDEVEFAGETLTARDDEVAFLRWASDGTERDAFLLREVGPDTLHAFVPHASGDVIVATDLYLVARFGVDGTRRWFRHRRVSAAVSARTHSVAVDGDDVLVAGGHFNSAWGSPGFDFGAGELEGNGFVARYDADGVHELAVGTSGYAFNEAKRLLADGAGRVWVAGFVRQGLRLARETHGPRSAPTSAELTFAFRLSEADAAAAP